MLNYLVQFQINIFALMILAVLFLIIKVRSKVISYGKTLLKAMMVATAVAIIIEPLTWMFARQLFFGAFFLEYSTNMVLVIMGPILGGLMLSYVDYYTFKDPQRVKDKMYYMHISILTFFVLMYNIFNPIYFRVDPLTNAYRSGPFLDVHFGILAIFYLYMLYFILKNKGKLSRNAYLIFILCFALPIIGMVVQMFESKLHFSWTVIVLAIFVVYIFLESTTDEEDYLTKLYNRRSSELYINHLLEIKEDFAVIILDLNLFKEINDDYGHKEGDRVLIAFAEILKKVFHRESLVARIGGDEFIVVMKNPDGKYLQRINEIKYLLKKHENNRVKTLTFGHGYHAYSNDMTMDELFTYADQKMYKDKREIKEGFI